MTRIVQLDDRTPLKIDPDAIDGPVWVCRCGLSDAWPYCDSSHKHAVREEPGMTYAYHRDKEGTMQRDIVPDPPAADPRTRAPAAPPT